MESSQHRGPPLASNPGPARYLMPGILCPASYAHALTISIAVLPLIEPPDRRTVLPSRAAVPVSRDKLIDLLWTDCDANRGRVSLRTTLAQVRLGLNERVHALVSHALVSHDPAQFWRVGHPVPMARFRLQRDQSFRVESRHLLPDPVTMLSSSRSRAGRTSCAPSDC